jgi:hypothetical protein
MKSYIQGLITGGVLVFAFFVLMGANNSGEVGRYAISTAAKDGKIYQTIFDTKIGKVTKRGIKKDNKFDY